MRSHPAPSVIDKKIPKSPLSFIWYVTQPHLKYFWISLTAVTIAQVLNTSTPFIFKSIIDSIHRVTLGTASVDAVWFWVIVYPIMMGIIFLTWRMSGFVGRIWITGLNATAYTTLFGYLSKHSHAYYSDRFAGSLSSKVSHASEGANSVSEAFLYHYYPPALGILLTTIYLGTTSIITACIFMLLIVILVPVNIYIAKYRRPYVVRYSAQATKARGYAVDAITNIAAVRQFVQERGAAAGSCFLLR